MKTNYRSTIQACLMGYLVQGIINNFLPLLFLTFQTSYRLSLEEVTLFVTVNFAIQLCMDFSSAFFLNKIGYRAAALTALGFATLGMVSLSFFPEIFPTPFSGLLCSVILYAIGGGFIEVIISPIVQACPGEHKERTMSLLHSFYCWGSVAVVVVSTLSFYLIGIENWKYIALAWAIVPAINFVLFLRVPLTTFEEQGEETVRLSTLLRNPTFWRFAIIILCAGATELAVVQWSSAFAESALHISKTVGDLAGPALFSVFMGLARVLYGKYGEKLRLERLMIFGGGLSIAAYLIMALIPYPVAALFGMALAGVAVATLWPGTYSLASERVKGGNAMFSFLALAGDIGCISGPTLIGFVSGAFKDDLKIGILFATVFPVIMVFAMLPGMRKGATHEK